MSSDDPQTIPDLPALIGSRICHDLISPIGAIGNGLELLSMSGTDGPEVALIRDSVANANARIRFFRIAFGHATAGQGTAHSEMKSILADIYDATRINLDWNIATDCRREEAKAAFLALQCLEAALPYGGDIRASRGDGKWHFTASSPKLKFDAALWAHLDGTACDALEPKNVQFALLAGTLETLGRAPRLHHESTTITLSF